MFRCCPAGYLQTRALNQRLSFRARSSVLHPKTLIATLARGAQFGVEARSETNELTFIARNGDGAISPHSGLIPASFTTFCHFACSDTMSFPNSAGLRLRVRMASAS